MTIPYCFACLHLQPRLHKHLAVLRLVLLGRSSKWCACIVNITGAGVLIIVSFIYAIIALAVIGFLAYAQCAVGKFVCTIYASFVTAAKDIAIAQAYAFIRSDFAAIDVNLCLTEDITLAIEVKRWDQILIHKLCSVAAPTVLTATATEDIAQDMTVVHHHMGLTSLEDGGIVILHTASSSLHRAATDGTNLAATIEAASHGTAIHAHIGIVHIAVHHIAATENVAGQLNGIGSLVVKFLLVCKLVIVASSGCLIACCRKLAFAIGGSIVFGSCSQFLTTRYGNEALITIANVAIVDGQVGCAIDRTTLTTTIGITQDGRNAIMEVVIGIKTFFANGDGIGLRQFFLRNTYHHIGLSRDIVGIASADVTCMLAHMAQIAAAIDVTHRAALDIDIGAGNKVITGNGILCQSEFVHHNTTLATAIDVPIDFTALQFNISGAAYHSIFTHAATVCIAVHITALHDMDIGVEVGFHFFTLCFN